MTDLETKLQSYDKKQLIPIAGLYFLDRDQKAGKPLVIEGKTKKEGLVRSYNYRTYQAISILGGFIGTIYGIAYLLQ